MGNKGLNESEKAELSDLKRDLGFAFGAIGIRFLVDLFGLNIAIQLVAFLAVGSGIFVLIVMKETKKFN